MYSLLIACLPESVISAAFLSVPFQGVCSVARCCGQSQRVAACAVALEAAAFSAHAFVMSRANGEVNAGFLTEGFKAEVEWKLCRFVWLRS